MSCLPRNSALVHILLLLLRTFISVVEGQVSTPVWNSRSEVDPSYRQQIGSDKVSLLNSLNSDEDRFRWPPESEAATGAATRGLNNALAPNPVRNPGLKQFFDTYIQAKNVKHPDRSNAAANVDAYANNQRVQQQAGSSVSGASMDYPFDEFAQQPGYSSTLSDEYIPAIRSKIKPRQARIARYLVFSNLKRNRDGYMCHFKLCQVGVSGKRLSM